MNKRIKKIMAAGTGRSYDMLVAPLDGEAFGYLGFVYMIVDTRTDRAVVNTKNGLELRHVTEVDETCHLAVFPLDTVEREFEFFDRLLRSQV